MERKLGAFASKTSENKNNHPALTLSEAPAWYKKLRSRSGIATLALEFCTLTAARSGEVLGAT